MLYNWSKVKAKKVSNRNINSNTNSNNNSTLSTVDFGKIVPTWCSRMFSAARGYSQRSKNYGKVWSDFPDPYAYDDSDRDNQNIDDYVEEPNFY